MSFVTDCGLMFASMGAMSRKVRVNISIFNLPRNLAVFGEGQAILNATEVTGAQGLQYTLLRHARGRRVARAVVESGIVHCFQQSFVGGKRPKELAYLYVMGSLEKSLDRLEPLQDIAESSSGGRKPVIVHPNEQRQPNRLGRMDYVAVKDSGRHGPLLHQPTIEEVMRAGVLSRDPDRTVANMLEWQLGIGLSEFVALDINHLLARRDTNDGPQRLELDWCTGFAGALAARGALRPPGEVQVSCQSDFGGRNRDLKDMLDGNFAETPHGQIVRSVAEHLPSDQDEVWATLETPPKEFAAKRLGIGWREGNRQLIQIVGASALAA